MTRNSDRFFFNKKTVLNWQGFFDFSKVNEIDFETISSDLDYQIIFF